MHERLETYAAVDTYLQEVGAHLAKLPPAVRDEELRELRGHLLALVAAGCELNEGHDEAVQAALRQFGAPRRIGRDLMSAWKRRHLKELWLATGYGYGTWSMAVLPAVAYLWVTTGAPQGNLPMPVAWWHSLGWVSLVAFYFGLLPFAAGWVAGMVAPRQGVRAVVWMISINVAFMLLQMNAFTELSVVETVLPSTLIYLATALPGALWGSWWKRRRNSESASAAIVP